MGIPKGAVYHISHRTYTDFPKPIVLPLQSRYYCYVNAVYLLWVLFMCFLLKIAHKNTRFSEIIAQKRYSKVCHFSEICVHTAYSHSKSCKTDTHFFDKNSWRFIKYESPYLQNPLLLPLFLIFSIVFTPYLILFCYFCFRIPSPQRWHKEGLYRKRCYWNYLLRLNFATLILEWRW